MVTRVDGVVRIDVQRLETFARKALEVAGAENDAAAAAAKGLCWASIRGIDSHGVRLLPHYVAGIRGGRINARPRIRFERTSASTGRLDANHTFGHHAGLRAIREAIDLAAEIGSAWVCVVNSSHCGALSFFAQEAAQRDMIGLAFTHATARVKAPNSSRPFLGNNPICLVAPMRDEGPFCFDASTTAMTFNEVKRYGELGRSLPRGVAADGRGRETTDPREAEQLVGIGDYKGFGISMLVDVLCAMLTGMPGGREVSEMYGSSMSEHRLLGHAFAAIRIDAFQPAETFKSRLQEMANSLRREPRLDSQQPVLVPGDPEKACESDRLLNGVPVEAQDLARYQALADEIGAPRLSL